MRRGRLAKFAKTLGQEAEKINLSIENNKITMQIPSSFQAGRPKSQQKLEDSEFEDQSAGEEEFLDGEVEEDSQMQGEEEVYEEDADLGQSEDSRLEGSDSVGRAEPELAVRGRLQRRERGLAAGQANDKPAAAADQAARGHEAGRGRRAGLFFRVGASPAARSFETARRRSGTS
jgi:hypothetical protein